MSNQGEAVRFVLKRLLGDLGPKYGKTCYARNVSADPLTGVMLIDCESIEDGSVIEDVRLCADFNENSTTAGLILVPKIDSIVIVSFIGESEAYLSMVSEVDYVYLNGNTYGGLVKVEDLVTKINNLETKVNTLISTLTSVTIPLAPSGTYPFAPIFSAITPLTPTTKTEIENDKVQHGDGTLI